MEENQQDLHEEENTQEKVLSLRDIPNFSKRQIVI